MFKRDHFELNGTSIHLIHYGFFDPTAFNQLLSEVEQERLKTFNHLKRQREFVSTRILKHELFGHKSIEYNSVGAPFIPNEGFLSISHSQNCSGIAVNEKFQLGMDLEQISDKALRLQDKFLTTREKLLFDCTNSLELTIAWSMKETLYKLANSKQLIFKENLRLVDRNGDLINALILLQGKKINVEIKYVVLPEMVLTINTSACEYAQNF